MNKKDRRRRPHLVVCADVSPRASMPRYFFNLHEADGIAEDPEGSEFPDILAARREAIAGARSIIKDGAGRGIVDLTGWIEVVDADGQPVLTVPFVEAVKLRLPG
jgi:hypothetical protein